MQNKMLFLNRVVLPLKQPIKGIKIPPLKFFGLYKSYNSYKIAGSKSSKKITLMSTQVVHHIRTYPSLEVAHISEIMQGGLYREIRSIISLDRHIPEHMHNMTCAYNHNYHSLFSYNFARA